MPKSPSPAEKSWNTFRDHLFESAQAHDDVAKISIVDTYLRVLGYLESKGHLAALADMLDVPAALRRRLQQAEMVFYRELADQVIRDASVLHAIERSHRKTLQQVHATMAAGRTKGAHAVRARAQGWHAFAVTYARDCWTGSTNARFWTVDKMADWLVPKIASQCRVNVAASTVARAIGGLKRQLGKGR